MKEKLLQKIVPPLTRNELAWKLIKPFAALGQLFMHTRERRNDINLEEKFGYLLDKKTVLNGPFKGMRYPELKSLGSTIFPKIIGSYEKELHPVLEKISDRNYTEIIDVGCAEGYYAVGLGLKFPKAKVFAYDINPKARQACAAMAKMNGISSQMHVRDYCSAKELQNFTFTGRGLIVSDCEGFEAELFTPENLPNLKNCDVLIEVHDFKDITISDYLKNLFGKTHHLTTIQSIDDIKKARVYSFPETDQLDLASRKELFKEARKHAMEWLFCEAK